MRLPCRHDMGCLLRHLPRGLQRRHRLEWLQLRKHLLWRPDLEREYLRLPGRAGLERNHLWCGPRHQRLQHESRDADGGLELHAGMECLGSQLPRPHLHWRHLDDGRPVSADLRLWDHRRLGTGHNHLHGEGNERLRQQHRRRLVDGLLRRRHHLEWLELRQLLHWRPNLERQHLHLSGRSSVERLQLRLCTGLLHFQRHALFGQRWQQLCRELGDCIYQLDSGHGDDEMHGRHRRLLHTFSVIWRVWHPYGRRPGEHQLHLDGLQFLGDGHRFIGDPDRSVPSRYDLGLQ